MRKAANATGVKTGSIWIKINDARVIILNNN